MISLTRIVEWDMGHRVPNHLAKCSNVHGHRYRAEISLSGAVKGENGEYDDGMIADFGEIKKIILAWIDNVLDHAYMGQVGPDNDILELLESKNMKVVRVDFVPTAENIVVFLVENLQKQLDLPITHIRLFETPNNFVDYAPTL